MVQEVEARLNATGELACSLGVFKQMDYAHVIKSGRRGYPRRQRSQTSRRALRGRSRNGHVA